MILLFGLLLGLAGLWARRVRTCDLSRVKATQAPRATGRDLQLVDHDAGPRVHSGQRVVSLVGVRTDHDHQAGPFIDPPLKRTPDGQASVWGNAMLLAGHVGVPRAAAGDRTVTGQSRPDDNHT